ncbi:hypothetical protein BAB78_02510 [Mycobacteroides abscessus]|nr:hypothetical protein BAB78_02510 [Mycobacteroides abscessus]
MPSRQRANAGLDQNSDSLQIIFREGTPARDPQVLIIARPADQIRADVHQCLGRGPPKPAILTEGLGDRFILHVSAARIQEKEQGYPGSSMNDLIEVVLDFAVERLGGDAQTAVFGGDVGEGEKVFVLALDEHHFHVCGPLNLAGSQ